MKILFVIPHFAPAWAYGGTPRVAYELSKALVRRGHEVSVYTTDTLNSSSRVEVKKIPTNLDGINVFYFKNLSNFMAYYWKFSTPSGMMAQVREEVAKFDLVHLHEFRTIPNIIVTREAKKQGIPLVLSPHGTLPIMMGRGFLKKGYDFLYGEKILDSTKKFIAVSQMEKDQLLGRRIGEGKITVIPNGLDLEFIKKSLTKGLFRKRIEAGDKKIILYLGRIHRIKGIDVLIKAFANIYKKDKNTILVVAGNDDGYQKQMEEIVKKLELEGKVLFTGYLEGAEKFSALSDADVVVCPSRFEIFGLVAFEAILCGTPVVVTDCFGGKEIIKKVGAGLIVKSGSVIKLQEAVEQILENPNVTKRGVEKGKKYIIDNLIWGNIAKKMEGIYKDVKK